MLDRGLIHSLLKQIQMLAIEYLEEKIEKQKSQGTSLVHQRTVKDEQKETLLKELEQTKIKVL